LRYKKKVTLDAAIVGGGPAGAAAALSLGQLMPGAAIAIFDSGTGGRWRPGEILSPGAAEILQALGCWSAFLESGFLESFGTRAAWGSPEPYENEFLFSLRGNGWRLNRARFDDGLRQCARAAGVEIHEGARLLDSTADRAGWRLQFRGFECHARFAIDASGRPAAFAVQRGARRLPDDRLAAAFVLFETEDAGDTLVEAAENGWWYSAGVPGATAVAAFMTDSDLIRQSRLYLAERWNELLAGSAGGLHGALAAPEPDERAGMGCGGRCGDDFRSAFVAGNPQGAAIGQTGVVRSRRFPAARNRVA
jgi:hypothetical protein